MVLQRTTGATRRTRLSGQAVVVGATSSLGLLVGGVVIERLGPQTSLLVAGVLTVLVTLVVRRMSWPGAGPATGAGGGRVVKGSPDEAMARFAPRVRRIRRWRARLRRYLQS